MSSIQRSTPSRLVLAALSAALVLGLAACAQDEGDQDQAAAPAGSSGAPAATPDRPGTEPEEANPDENPDDAADEAPDDAPLASGTACLVGTWVADNANIGAVLQQTAGDVNLAAPTGEVLITYSADGRHTVTYRAWTFTMSQDGVTIEVVRDGTDAGTYQATEDGGLTATVTDMDSVVSMKSPAGTHSTPGEPSTMTGTFTCEGSSLEITVDGDTSIMTRQ